MFLNVGDPLFVSLLMRRNVSRSLGMGLFMSLDPAYSLLVRPPPCFLGRGGLLRDCRSADRQTCNTDQKLCMFHVNLGSLELSHRKNQLAVDHVPSPSAT
ncbi:hypothetical protein [Rhizorhabdus argentea]|uniref:hypothetical protein n=1 Tax=Rhizorhabdus argentea TaxID=1387174 RepID=UPI0030ECE9E6